MGERREYLSVFVGPRESQKIQIILKNNHYFEKKNL